MHPIEHLRYIARTSGFDTRSMIYEAATAFGSLHSDHASLVVACRRMIESHYDEAAMWWLCAHLLTSDDPTALAWELAAQFDEDPTIGAIADQIPEAATVVIAGSPAVASEALALRPDVRVLCLEPASARPIRHLDGPDIEPVAADSLSDAVAAADLVFIDAIAACPDMILSPKGSNALAGVAQGLGTPVWLAVGLGRRLPSAYVHAIASELLKEGVDPIEIDEVLVGLVSEVVPAEGHPAGMATSLRPDCPLAPELLRSKSKR